MFRIARRLVSSPQRLTQKRNVANITPQTSEASQGHLPSSQSPIVSKLHFFNSVTGDGQQIPTFRVLDGMGKPINGAQVPEVNIVYSSFSLVILTSAVSVDGPELCTEAVSLPRISQLTDLNCIRTSFTFLSRYENMQLLPTLDNILYNVQRQGKISFYVCLFVQTSRYFTQTFQQMTAVRSFDTMRLGDLAE